MKLWLNNRLDHEYELRFDELCKGFGASKWSRLIEPEHPWPIERRVGAYLGDILHSVWDIESAEGRNEFELLCDAALHLERERAAR